MFGKKDKEQLEFPSYIKLEGGRIRTDINEMLKDEKFKKRLQKIKDLDIGGKDK